MRLHARTCPVCKNGDYSVLFADQSRGGECTPPIESNYVKCKSCGFIYLNPIPDPEDLTIAYNEMPNWIRPQGQSDKYLNQLERIFSPLLDRVEYYHTMPHNEGAGRKILDIGCGSGTKLVTFEERGWEVHGLDVSSPHIETAKQQLPSGHFYCCELAEAGFSNDYFDCIRIDNVLEHLLEPIEILKEIYRILKPEGELFIYVPNGNSFTLRYRPTCSMNSWVPFHLSLFTQDTIRSSLQQAGFGSNIKVTILTPISLLFGFLKSCIKKVSRAAGMSGIEKIIAVLVLTPFNWILSMTGLGEELVICVRKL